MRIISGILIGAALAFATGWFFFRPMPTTAELVSPDSEVIAAQLPSTGITLEWQHGGDINFQGGIPQRTRNFVVCVYPSFSGQQCQLINLTGSQPDFRHIAPPADFTRSALSGVQHVGGNNAPYAYEFDVDIAEDNYDQNLSWSVAACGTGRAGCATALPKRMVLTARNINVTNVSDSVFPPNLVAFDIEIENTGGVDTGPFELQTSVYEILVDSAGQPISNVNNIAGVANWGGTSIGNDDAVIMRDGAVQSVFLLDLLGDGQRDSSDVWAILRPGGTREFWQNDIWNIAAGTATLRYKPCPSSQQVSTRCQVTIGHSMRPTAFAAISTADPRGLVTEYDRSDNRVMERNIRMF